MKTLPHLIQTALFSAAALLCGISASCYSTRDDDSDSSGDTVLDSTERLSTDEATDTSMESDADTDTDTDADTDTDSDTDSDSDTDADTDSDSETDTELDTSSENGTDDTSFECLFADPFRPADCPSVEIEDTLIRYVNADVAMPGDGRSWETAFADLQEAIDACACAATALGTTCLVWAAAGTYDVYSKDACDTIRLRSGVGVYGGFLGDELSFDERNWKENETTLDGKEAVYHVVTGADGAVIDGFTIRGGSAQGTADDTTVGGGMLNLETSPTVANCRLVQNAADSIGGGMYNFASSVTVTNCAFEDNAAENGGGLGSDASELTVTRCTFERNRAAQQGGGMYNQETAAMVTNSTFEKNHADRGGGISHADSHLTLINTLLFENSAEYGSAMSVIPFEAASLINCTITKNESAVGESVFFASRTFIQTLTIMNSIVWGNSPSDFFADTWMILGSEDPIASQASSELKSSPIVILPPPPQIIHSDIGGCLIDGAWNPEYGEDRGGNIDEDPLFVDASSKDFSLTEASPCIDAGSPLVLPEDAVDLDYDGVTDEPIPVDRNDRPRVRGEAVDMGAFEYAP